MCNAGDHMHFCSGLLVYFISEFDWFQEAKCNPVTFQEVDVECERFGDKKKKDLYSLFAAHLTHNTSRGPSYSTSMFVLTVIC